MTETPQNAALDLQRQLGNNLKAARQRAGMSQRELATAIEMGRNLIGAIERGEQNVTLKTLNRLAQAIGTNERVLLFGDPPPERCFTTLQAEQVADALHARLHAMVALRGSKMMEPAAVDRLVDHARDEVRVLLATDWIATD